MGAITIAIASGNITCRKLIFFSSTNIKGMTNQVKDMHVYELTADCYRRAGNSELGYRFLSMLVQPGKH